jgi:hypothetical protein
VKGAASAIGLGTLPNWYPPGNTPPAPVPWNLDPVFENNTCYFGPKGSGAEWQANAMGCHNPRLDSDNIDCNPSVTDPMSNEFCHPENTNIDFPSGDWTRIGVHYFNDPSPEQYDIHPSVRIFCDGQLAAELGAAGYDAPVTFTPAMGTGQRAFWLAADVAYHPTDGCDEEPRCEVVPLHDDSVLRTPLISNDNAVSAAWVGPAYPPPITP